MHENCHNYSLSPNRTSYLVHLFYLWCVLSIFGCLRVIPVSFSTALLVSEVSFEYFIQRLKSKKYINNQ